MNWRTIWAKLRRNPPWWLFIVPSFIRILEHGHMHGFWDWLIVIAVPVSIVVWIWKVSEDRPNQEEGDPLSPAPDTNPTNDTVSSPDQESEIREYAVGESITSKEWKIAIIDTEYDDIEETLMVQMEVERRGELPEAPLNSFQFGIIGADGVEIPQSEYSDSGNLFALRIQHGVQITETARFALPADQVNPDRVIALFLSGSAVPENLDNYVHVTIPLGAAVSPGEDSDVDISPEAESSEQRLQNNSQILNQS